MNSLVISDVKVPGLYGRMQTAITQCYDLDDCKVIADQASAIAAYYKQIKDDESMRKFLAVKLRAWRRIGEICAATDASDCPTKAEYYEKIRHIFPDLKHHEIGAAVRVAALPADFFEQVVETHNKSMAHVLSAYNDMEPQETSQGRVWVDRKKEARQREDERQAEAFATARENHEPLTPYQLFNDLCDSHHVAYQEVGYTMDRRDRRTMKTVVLLLKEPLHATLRQAAFDHHLTMQEVIRQGLLTWLKVNNYQAEE